MTFLKICIPLALVGLSLGMLAVEPPTQPTTQLTEGVKPIHAYMIYDPQGDNWLGLNQLGLTTWGRQEKGQIWVDKKVVTRTHLNMFGGRANRSQVKTFLLIPVKN